MLNKSVVADLVFSKSCIICPISEENGSYLKMSQNQLLYGVLILWYKTELKKL